MNIKNIVALSMMLVVGYVTYSMQQPAESSAMAAARGSGREAPSLKQLAATKIARMLHDGEMTIDLAGMPADPQERMTALDKFFHNQAQAIGDAYCRLYPNELPVTATQTQKIPGSTIFLVRLSDGSFIVTIDDYRAFRTIQRWRLQPDGKFVSTEELKVARPNIYNNAMAVSLDGNLMCIGPKLPMTIYARDSNGKFQSLQAITGDTDWDIGCCALYSDTVSKTFMVRYSNRSHQPVLDIYDWSAEQNRFEKLQEMIEDDWDVTIIDNNCFIAAAWDRVTVWARNAIGEKFTLHETLFTGKIERHGSTALSLDKRVFAWSSVKEKQRISIGEERIIILERDPQNHFTRKQEIMNGRYHSNSFYLSSNGRRFIMTDDLNAHIWVSDSQGQFSRVKTVNQPDGSVSKAILAGTQEDYLVAGGGLGLTIYKLVYPDIWNHILEHQKAFQD